MIDALRRNGSVDFVHVRHEKYGVFAAVAEARLTGNPVAVSGTAGPGVTHLINGLLDARKERAPVIAIAGDVESSLLDSDALEELNPNADEGRRPGRPFIGSGGVAEVGAALVGPGRCLACCPGPIR